MPITRYEVQAYAQLGQIAKDQARAAEALESIAASLAALVGAQGRVGDTGLPPLVARSTTPPTRGTSP